MEVYNQHVIDGITHKAKEATQAYIKSQISDAEYEKCICDYNADMNLEVMSYCECKFGSPVNFNQIIGKS